MNKEKYSLRQIKVDLQSFYYYLNACTNRNSRIELLKKYASKKYEFKHRKPLEVRRINFLASAKRKLSKLIERAKFRLCSACFNFVEIRHHIIQLQNGGDNRKKNIITLCNDCHEEIHPWLRVT